MRDRDRRVYYGWFVLAAISGINFANSATSIGVLTVFIIPLTEEFGWTRTQISAVTSVGAVLGALAAPFTGRLTDRLGARIPLTLGGFFIVLAMLNLAAMQSLSWFYLAFGLARLADQGFVQAPSPPAIAKWFQRYRARAIAVLSFTSSAGGVALPLLVQLVITVWHWRMAWAMLSGVMLFVGLLPCALLVRRQPEDLGIPVDGE
ncbi:MAG: MFS transporter, partial [Nitrospinae bacterium]|nr:MFS transporter [Nitrospinota bacterium]